MTYVVIAFLPLPLTWTVWLCDVKIFYENPKNYWDGYRWDMTVDAFGVSLHSIYFFNLNKKYFFKYRKF